MEKSEEAHIQSPSKSHARTQFQSPSKPKRQWIPHSGRAIIATTVLAVIVVLGLVLGLTLGLLLHRGNGNGSGGEGEGPSVKLGYATYRGTWVGNGTGEDAGNGSDGRTSDGNRYGNSNGNGNVDGNGNANGTEVGMEGKVAQYLGLRYAAPPVGARRFRAPQEPEIIGMGEEVVRANEFGPICLGTSHPYPSDAEDEDCLFANVWTPANATVDSKLPVWLFIQGGGYTQNANANWNGSYVVERSGNRIVLVNFNYRVGLYGFLASERVHADGDLNAGLLDQRAMMRWVKKHIIQFGGDPEHVVIHGASAGAGSVALHLVVNDTSVQSEKAETVEAQDQIETENLFVGAIGESVFFPAQPFLHELEWQFNLTLERTGCDEGVGGVAADEAMDCLRDKSTEELQAANVPAAFPSAPPGSTPLFFWTPCIDGALLPDLPYRLFEKGAFLDVAVIMGSTTNEGTVFATETATRDDMTAFFLTNYPHLSPLNTSAIASLYPQQANSPFPNHAAWFPSTAEAYGETTFTCPVSLILDSYTQNITNKNNNNTPRAWGYRYDVQDAENDARGVGVPHIFDSWAIFGPDSEAGEGGGPQGYYTYNAEVVPIVMDYYISFVRTLDPSKLRSPGTPVWENWGAPEEASGRRRLKIRTGDVVVEMEPEDQVERCEFWKGLAEVMRQ
ncbi:alpha/beta-hydrolase [Astrocystis sublimbata]|nr:alpha/beta-hydrolase [Astrocystis sublimbata]